MKTRVVIDGKTYEVEYETNEPSSAPSPSLERAQSIVLPTPCTPTLGATGVDEAKVCRSPVAGIVSRILVEPGQSVQSGDVLMVVEAMKMENNLTAARSTKVNAVKVEVGNSVKAGQIVVEFEQTTIL